jgi:hypothetical protein
LGDLGVARFENLLDYLLGRHPVGSGLIALAKLEPVNDRAMANAAAWILCIANLPWLLGSNSAAR